MDSVVEHGEKGWRERGRERGWWRREIPRDRPKKVFSFRATLTAPSSSSSSFDESLARLSRKTNGPRWETDVSREKIVLSIVVPPPSRSIPPPPPPLYTGNGIVIESYIDNLSTIRFLPFQDYILIPMVCSKIIESTSYRLFGNGNCFWKSFLPGILSKVYRTSLHASYIKHANRLFRC